MVENMVIESAYEQVRQTIFYIDSFKLVFFINVSINPQMSAGRHSLLSKRVIIKKPATRSSFGLPTTNTLRSSGLGTRRQCGRFFRGHLCISLTKFAIKFSFGDLENKHP